MVKKLTDEQEQQIFELDGKGLTLNQIGNQVGVHPTTVSRYLKSPTITREYLRTPGGLKVVDGMGTCKKCCETKEVEDFGRHRISKTYRTTCEACWQTMAQEKKNTDILAYLSKRLSCMRGKDSACDFTKHDLLEMYESQNHLCFYTGEALVWGTGNRGIPSVLSVDKIIPNKGYKKGNVVLCCNWINAMKQNADLETLKIWMPLVYEKIQQGYDSGILY